MGAEQDAWHTSVRYQNPYVTVNVALDRRYRDVSCFLKNSSNELLGLDDLARFPFSELSDDDRSVLRGLSDWSLSENQCAFAARALSALLRHAKPVIDGSETISGFKDAACGGRRDGLPPEK